MYHLDHDSRSYFHGKLSWLYNDDLYPFMGTTTYSIQEHLNSHDVHFIYI
jgi:hypothetical protein